MLYCQKHKHSVPIVMYGYLTQERAELGGQIRTIIDQFRKFIRNSWPPRRSPYFQNLTWFPEMFTTVYPRLIDDYRNIIRRRIRKFFLDFMLEEADRRLNLGHEITNALIQSYNYNAQEIAEFKKKLMNCFNQ